MSISLRSRAEKTAKKILKTQPMNLSLWNVYGQLVMKLKGKQEAQKVYLTILNMYKSFPASQHYGIGAIYACLVELLVMNNEKEKAIHVLYCFAIKTAPNFEVTTPNAMKEALQILDGAVSDEMDLLSKKVEFQSRYSTEMSSILHLIQNTAMLHFLVEGDAESIIKVALLIS